jgi:hypothetical protein
MSLLLLVLFTGPRLGAPILLGCVRQLSGDCCGSNCCWCRPAGVQQWKLSFVSMLVRCSEQA